MSEQDKNLYLILLNIWLVGSIVSEDIINSIIMFLFALLIFYFYRRESK